MSEDIVIRHGAPTLAGVKTASLFGYPCSSYEELRDDIREMNRVLRNKGIIVIPMCFRENRALLYIYRPERLERDLKDLRVIRLLKESGYSCGSVYLSVAELAKKLKNYRLFPHEIGIFLGYPPEDVLGFIRNKAECYKCSGCWKVYGDPEKAKKCFKIYDTCTSRFMEQYSKGKHLKDLAV